MATAHVDSDGIEQQLVEEIQARLDGLRADTATDILLTLVTIVLYQVYKDNFLAADKAIDSLASQLKETVRMEFTIQETEDHRGH